MFVELIKENTTRKVDSLGRVSIPKSMRDRLMIKEGDELEFYILRDGENQYVTLGKPCPAVAKYAKAVEVLEELDLDVPDALMRLVMDSY